MDSLRKILNDKKFVSLESLRQLFTPQFVGTCLESSGMPPTQDLVSAIIAKAPKLFAVLLLIENENYIKSLLEHGLDDDAWPLLETEVPEFENVQKREQFYKAQWLIPPVLTNKRHLDLPGDAPLPFVEKSFGGHGSFGVIWKVKVSPGHLQAQHKVRPRSSTFMFCNSLLILLSKGYVAMKTVRSGRSHDWDIVMREVETLRKREHQNIVPLLASFTINAFDSEERSLNILFPWADMNMAQWLRLDSTPLREDIEMRDWLYREIYALVSAVSFLHREIDGMVTSHHDLKPENILWLGGSLKICDLGRSHLLSVADGSETEGQSGLGTFTYQPPEYYNDDATRSSKKHGRAFDVWSLGCILIEMVILIVHGWQGRKIKEFTEARSAGVRRRGDFSKTREVDDSFHNNPDVIRQWICDLKENESRMLAETLTIAEKMLADNPDERLYSWEAELDLFDLLYPDARAARLEKMKTCVQPPKQGLPSHAENPLHRAVRNGNKDRVVRLLSLGWPVDVQDNLGLTPIRLADQHTNVDFRTIFGSSPSSRTDIYNRNVVLQVPQGDRRITFNQRQPGSLTSLKILRM
jgi:serine/threonine protein kinase